MGGGGDEGRDPPRAPMEDTLLRWDRSEGPGCAALLSVPSICRGKEKEQILESGDGELGRERADLRK